MVLDSNTTIYLSNSVPSYKEAVLSTGDCIQLFIAGIMLLTTGVTLWYTYKSNKHSDNERNSQVCVDLCVDLMREERKLLTKLKENKTKFDKHEYDYLLFSFFEQASLLFLSNKVDKKIFIDYFKRRLILVYEVFIESKSFNKPRDRIRDYPNFCILANNLGMPLIDDIESLEKNKISKRKKKKVNRQKTTF